jgi:hypothetical protein
VFAADPGRGNIAGVSRNERCEQRQTGAPMNPVFKGVNPFPSATKPGMPAHIQRIWDQYLHYPSAVSDVEVAGAAAHFQSRADEAFALHGLRAPPIQVGEGLANFRRRLLGSLLAYCDHAAYHKIDATKVDPSILDTIEATVIDDAIDRFKSPTGPLRSAVETDASGRRITRFFGDPSETWRPFQPSVRRRLVGMKNTATGKNSPSAVVPVQMVMSDGTVRRL